MLKHNFIVEVKKGNKWKFYSGHANEEYAGANYAVQKNLKREVRMKNKKGEILKQFPESK